MHIIDVAPGPSKQRENQEIISQVVRSADDDMNFFVKLPTPIGMIYIREVYKY